MDFSAEKWLSVNLFNKRSLVGNSAIMNKAFEQRENALVNLSRPKRCITHFLFIFLSAPFKTQSWNVLSVRLSFDYGFKKSSRFHHFTEITPAWRLKVLINCEKVLMTATHCWQKDMLKRLKLVKIHVYGSKEKWRNILWTDGSEIVVN